MEAAEHVRAKVDDPKWVSLVCEHCGGAVDYSKSLAVVAYEAEAASFIAKHAGCKAPKHGGIPAEDWLARLRAVRAAPLILATRRPPLTCSFCSKTQSPELRVVAGPNGVAICHECNGLCDDIFLEPPSPQELGEPERITSGTCNTTSWTPDPITKGSV